MKAKGKPVLGPDDEQAIAAAAEHRAAVAREREARRKRQENYDAFLAETIFNYGRRSRPRRAQVSA